MAALAGEDRVPDRSDPVMRRWRAALAGLALLGADALAAPFPGIDYQELRPPQPTADVGVEVVEFFWYRCPHCYDYEPDLRAWVERLPRGVAFRRVPVVFNDDWAIDARLFYALDAMGELERLHAPLFDALHRDGGRRLRGKAYEDWLARWLPTQGIRPAHFRDVLASRAVRERVTRARRMTKTYRIAGTPTFVVQGRYVVTPEAGERRAVLAILDHLIEAARSGEREDDPQTPNAPRRSSPARADPLSAGQ